MCLMQCEHDCHTIRLAVVRLSAGHPPKKDLMVWTEDEILHIQLNGIN